jgi:hypothetical protein
LADIIKKDMSIIRLTTCYNIIEANMLKNILANEEIECFLTNENFTSLMPGYNGMLGAGIQVMIEEKDYEKADKLLQNQNSSDIIKCPKCNSENISFGLGINRIKKIIIAILSALTATPMGNIRGTYYCKDCKHDFKITLDSQ